MVSVMSLRLHGFLHHQSFAWRKNNAHVDEAHDPAFLDVLERLIANMDGMGNRSRGRWMDATPNQ